MHFLRILDVNLNRLDESLKLIEDTVRFGIENNEMLMEMRKVRRDFLDLKLALPQPAIIGSRQSKHDLGRKQRFDTSEKREISDLLLANLARAKESARIVEEILKTVKPRLRSRAKSIRFQLYDLEKEIVVHINKSFDPALHAVIDETYLKELDVKRTVKTMIKSGVTMIQLRAKTMKDADLLRVAKKIRKTVDHTSVKFIINNRLDIALACVADGVHLGHSDIPVREARKIAGDMLIIGASAHNLKQAIRAETQGADYLGVGAVYPTRTKKDARVCGIESVRIISGRVRIPVIAIGGVTDKNYRAILRAGAAGIAVSSYLFEGDLRQRLRSLTHESK